MALDVVAGLLAIASWTDLTSYRIPNWISVTILGLFAGHVVWAGMPATEVIWHGVAFGTALAAGFGLFAWGKFGGGDAKLLAAVALWIGWNQALIDFILLTAMLGGVLSALLLLCRASTLGTAAGAFFLAHGWDFAIFNPAKKLAPYAVAIAGAFWITQLSVMVG